MFVTCETINGYKYSYAYTTPEERDRWFRDIIIASRADVREQRFRFIENRLIVTGIGDFTFDNRDECRAAWFRYLGKAY
jgi:hypothetical protein